MAKMLKFCMFIFIALTMLSCSKDEPNESSNPLVGTWSCSNHYYGGTDYYHFNSNGTFTWECPGSWFDSQTGHYTFDNGLLFIVDSEGTSWIYMVEFSTSKNVMFLTDEDGYTYGYFKE